MHQRLTCRLLEYRNQLKINRLANVVANDNYLWTISIYSVDKRIPNVFRSIFSDYKQGNLFAVRLKKATTKFSRICSSRKYENFK